MTTTVHADEYRELLDKVFGSCVAEWTHAAEETGQFPRQLIEYLGNAEVFAHKWSTTPHPDLEKHFELAYRLGSVGSAGIGVGISLHDSAIAILRRFARTAYLRGICEEAIRGRAVLCIGASEESGGSDLQNVHTVISRNGAGYSVRGAKKFVSLSTIADHVLVVARSIDHDPASRHGNVALVTVPVSRVTVGRPYRKIGAGPLETAALTIDTWVPEDALIARAGTGLAAISWGLAHERLSIAGQVAAACDRALAITLARMVRRSQFGRTLFEHQALRLRMADLQSRVDVLRLALDGIARGGRMNLRTAAAVKVTAARLGEEVISECMHIFGGSGYLIDETPIGRWWCDMKLARIGGGTDEVLWELVAAVMRPDFETYRSLVQE